MVTRFGGFLVALAFAASAFSACKKEPEMVKVKHQAIDQKKFETLYRAAKAIQAAQAVGLNYQKFSELQQAFATEISIGKDKASTTADKAMVAAYGEALLVTADCAEMWKGQIESSTNEYIPQDTIFLEDNQLAIAKKYGLEIKTLKMPYTGAPYQAIAGARDAVSRLLSRVDEAMGKGNQLYLAEVETLEPKLQ